MTLSGAGYEISFDEARDVLVLGDEATRGHSDMALVDFVVECDDRYVFVEITEAGDRDGAMKSDALCDELARKYRDSMFFHSFGGRSPKCVEYAVLYLCHGVDGILVTALQDELKRRIPLSHPVWNADSAASCFVMNVEQWKKRYGDDSIRRSDGLV